MSDPSFCWHCGKALTYHAGAINFAIVVDQLGNQHRVHKQCLDDAAESMRGRTAQQKVPA